MKFFGSIIYKSIHFQANWYQIRRFYNTVIKRHDKSYLRHQSILECIE
jgi:hypothetical protein